ncbi:transcriptional regulator NrdR [Derxia gummosa]|uniref:Transcriptional repressor NrdR n=1 Tax=Derxia gummosa DSM 723 TaxID=1121388 RepID=A0A8B6X1R5_9BURK|nr:transcriptional regulator NrdR [Derxia gummosa]
MHCPFCGHDDTSVLETRLTDGGSVNRRRRRCPSCDKRFTTYERIEVMLPVVVKRDGSRVEYSREKLKASFTLALRKRPVSAAAVDDAIQRIEDKLVTMAAKEVPSERIGELVMRELKKLDKIAYIRFASVYFSFNDVGEFKEVIQEVEKSRRR